MYDELKLYCKSEGLTEYLRSEMKIGGQVKDAGSKTKGVLNTERKDQSPVKRGLIYSAIRTK